MSRTAVLEVISPLGESRRYDLTGTQYTIGRAVADHRPDVVLGPDPQGWISRLHCILDYEHGRWWVTDHARNGTLIERDDTPGGPRPVSGRQMLHHQDRLLIIGDMADGDVPLHWRLVYIDADERTLPARQWYTTTTPARLDLPAPRARLRYDWVASRAYRVDPSGAETLIEGLRPKGHQLLRFMVGRGRSQSSDEVACDHAELITALWGPREDWPVGRTYDNSDVAAVVYAVRKCVEPEPGNPVVLETVPTLGYRLHIYHAR
ncbi:FHA domain-containing protein [Nonomuraea sp. NPDC048882]|uniref:FHA domain-containing protein n=1 Tax=unclassified Nonomuraea TaxID=2593643 RepID=UPI000A9E0D9A